MSITDTMRKAGPYNGDDATVIFNFTFALTSTADVLVILNTGAEEVVQTLDSQYSVSLNADQNDNPGGSITMLTAPETGETITIGSNQAETQTANIRNMGAFHPGVVEDALDRAAINAQQNEEKLTRSLQIPISDPASGGIVVLPPASVRAGKAVVFDDDGNVGVSPTDYADAPGTAVDFIRTIFVGKHGSDSNDGKSLGKAKLTFAAAITAASALAPTSSARVAIVCLDAGNYLETSTITVPENVDLYAPNATLRPSAAHTTLQLTQNSSAVLYCLIQDQGGTAALLGVNDAGAKFFRAQKVEAAGASAAIGNSATASGAELHIDVQEIEIETGIGIGDISTGGFIHVDVGSIEITGDSGTGIFSGGSGDIQGSIDHIHEVGAPSTTVGVSVAAGHVDLTVREIVTDTAINVASGATLHMFVAKVSGTVTNAGTMHVSESGNSSEFFRVRDNTDETKEIDFDLSNITTATKRTITMPDHDVDLGAMAYILIQDQKASSVAGGTSVIGSWLKRTLNTEVADDGGYATLSSSVVALDAGTWIAKWRSPIRQGDRHQSKLINTSDTIEYLGSSAFAASAATDQNDSFGSAKFTITSTKNFEVQYQTQTALITTGLGVAVTWGGNVYAQLEFWKVK